jgi:putative transposase
MGGLGFANPSPQWVDSEPPAMSLDLRSRHVIGEAMRDQLDRQLMLTALAMAIRQRCIRPGLIHYSNQGASYSCVAYQQ